MNQFEMFTVGFGNDKGQTSALVLQQKKNKIQIVNIKSTNIENPKIEVRKFNAIALGPIQDCIRKKRDRDILTQLLKININCDLGHISTQCQAMETKIANDLAVLNALMEESNTQKFIQKTKATGKQAQKYLSKYKNCEEAVNLYQKHQQMIRKFMTQNKCDRDNAICFLQSNNYDENLLF